MIKEPKTQSKIEPKVIDITPVPYAPLEVEGGGVHEDLVVVSLEQLIEAQARFKQQQSALLERVIEELVGTKDSLNQVGVTKNTAGIMKNYIWVDDLITKINQMGEELK